MGKSRGRTKGINVTKDFLHPDGGADIIAVQVRSSEVVYVSEKEVSPTRGSEAAFTLRRGGQRDAGLKLCASWTEGTCHNYAACSFAHLNTYFNVKAAPSSVGHLRSPKTPAVSSPSPSQSIEQNTQVEGASSSPHGALLTNNVASAFLEQTMFSGACPHEEATWRLPWEAATNGAEVQPPYSTHDTLAAKESSMHGKTRDRGHASLQRSNTVNAAVARCAVDDVFDAASDGPMSATVGLFSARLTTDGAAHNVVNTRESVSGASVPVRSVSSPSVRDRLLMELVGHTESDTNMSESPVDPPAKHFFCEDHRVPCHTHQPDGVARTQQSRCSRSDKTPSGGSARAFESLTNVLTGKPMHIPRAAEPRVSQPSRATGASLQHLISLLTSDE